MDESILIVDDAIFARKLTRKTLEENGYTNVREAVTAKEALEKIEEALPAIILLDITLPDRKDLSLLKEILDKYPDMKIIMLSAVGQELIIADAIEMGAREFVSKPFKKDEFLKLIRTVLDE